MISRILLGVVVFATILISTPSWGAITPFCVTSSPADNGIQGGSIRSVTPCGGMAANDYVVVIASIAASTAQTISNSTTGGQTWTSETEIDNSGPTLHTRVFHTRYNGSWAANPAFTVSPGDSNSFTLQMFVFRGVDTTTALDVAVTGAAFSAPGTPFDVTINEITTATNNALVLAIWVSRDDVSWALQTGGWTASTPPYVRNTAGSDHSQGSAYKIQTSAGATGNVVSRQDQGGDAGVGYILALKPAVEGGGGGESKPKVIFIQ